MTDQLPKFPELRKMVFTDKDIITSYATHFNPYSDFNFASLWSYNVNDTLCIGELNNNLIILFPDYTSTHTFYTLLGKNNLAETCLHLLNNAQSPLLPVLKLVPEEIANELATANIFLIQEDRDNFDYILSSSEIADLKTQRFHTHKNHINRLETKFPNITCSEINLLDTDIQQAILTVFYTWEKGRGKERKDTIHELTALQRLLSQADQFNLITLGVYDNDVMVGFSISDIDRENYAQIHFAKADPVYKEIYYLLNNSLAKKLTEKNTSYINMEQDLGIAGLRFSKEQWNPITYLKKYIVEKI
jgi:hypothetical protein